MKINRPSLFAVVSVVLLLSVPAFAVQPGPTLNSYEYREQKRDEFQKMMFGTAKAQFCQLPAAQIEQIMGHSLSIASKLSPRILVLLDDALREAEAAGDFKREGEQSALVAYTCNSDKASPMPRFPD